MDSMGKLKKFMKFLCKKYETDDILRSYGEVPCLLELRNSHKRCSSEELGNFVVGRAGLEPATT